ncbi:MAG: GntR family transcriptional regulator [Microbacterium sp.]
MTHADEVYGILRGRIVAFELPPGSRISERTLAASLGYGLTPVRDALARLELERFVESVPRVGTRVTRLGVSDMLEILDNWAVLCAEIYWQGVVRLSPEQRREVIALGGRTERLRAASTPEAGGWTSPVAAAYELLAAVSGNRRLRDIAMHAEAEMQRVFALLDLAPDARQGLREIGLPPFPSLDPQRVDEDVASIGDFHRRTRRLILRFAAHWPDEQPRTEIGPSSRD